MPIFAILTGCWALYSVIGCIESNAAYYQDLWRIQLTEYLFAAILNINLQVILQVFTDAR